MSRIRGVTISRHALALDLKEAENNRNITQKNPNYNGSTLWSLWLVRQHGTLCQHRCTIIHWLTDILPLPTEDFCLRQSIHHIRAGEHNYTVHQQWLHLQQLSRKKTPSLKLIKKLGSKRLKLTSITFWSDTRATLSSQHIKSSSAFSSLTFFSVIYNKAATHDRNITK